MAWRFKASKYKNSTPIVPKPELCVRDLAIGSYQTFGNNIAASASFMAFNWEHVGSSIAVLPLDDCGRKSKTMPLLHAHSDTVTDLDFSPFHDGLLASASQDCLVKVWHIPEGGLKESLLDAECTFSHRQKRVETVGFHPTSNCLLHSTSGGSIILYDLTSESEFFCNGDHPDTIQSLSWKQDGTIMATNTKDKKVRVVDPRSNSIVLTADSHQSIKDSRIIWLGTQERILTTGFDANRIRQIMIRDVRNFSVPEKTLDLDCSTGILMPLFDMDTNMLFAAGKGDTTISFLEITDKDPYLVEGIRHSGEQTKGACLVPKRALRVMEGEVNRVLQLTSSSVIPIMYQVPRKTYRDFHNDIFPETNGYKSELSPKEWFAGKNAEVHKISLDPSKRTNGDNPIIVLKGNLKEVASNLNNSEKNRNETKTNPKVGVKPYVPMKNKIQLMENEQVKSKNECEEFKQKHKSIMTQKLIENYENEPELSDCVSNETTENGKDSSNGQDCELSENGNAPIDVPPKPLPRKSISDQGSFDENCPLTLPKPRPRTAGSNITYKTRLGPKPFSIESAEVSFDKVFAVPTPPSNDKETKNLVNEDDRELLKVDPQINYPPPPTTEDNVNSDEAADDVESEPNSDEIDTKRSSIADRRKLYENRSLSMIEDKKKITAPIGRGESFKDNVESKNIANQTNGSSVKSAINSKRTSTVFGKVSKFRHLKGTTGHKSTQIENVKNINRQISGECDGFHANFERVAVPLTGGGGKIAVIELSTPGRLPDGIIPVLVNGSNIMDFQWDPFDNKKLVVACDDGTIKIWNIPENGLTESTNTPSQELNAHSEKIHFIKFHPLAKNVMLTASYDMTIKIWDLKTMEEKQCLKGHTDQVFGFSWSSCGTYGATVCKDGKLRIYDVRKSPLPIREGIGGPCGTRGARISYVLDDDYLVVTGFDKVSERQIYILKVDNLNTPIGMVGLDVSPAILVPFYDEDSSTLFLTGRGDTTIYAYEVTDEAPYFCPLSHHRCSSLHQGLSFLPKNQCDVRIVEFAKCYRLTKNSIEPLSFTVPRLKTEFFQDDLFPPTRVTWSETISASEWFDNKNLKPLRMSLQPNNMECLTLSVVPASQPPANKNENNEITYTTSQMSPEHIKSKENALKKSVSERVQLNYELEQDTMEGVDSNEWDE